MRRSVFIALMLTAFPLWALPRNPFIPFVSPCENVLRQLEKWRLYGVVTSPEKMTALMRSPGNSWRRIEAGEAVIGQGYHLEIYSQQAAISLGESCDSARYHWNIKGKKHGTDAVSGTAGGTAADKLRQ